MFADKVEIEVRAGKGGDGKVSFRHEKFMARGGPDGGDGGHGGDVLLRVDHNLNTLSRYRTNRRIRAVDGQTGGNNRKKGKGGEDVVLPVPVGTMVMESLLSSSSGSDPRIVSEGSQVKPGMTAKPIVDLTRDGQTTVIAKGGRGGFGNAHFTSSTRQTPRAAELGESGELRHLTLELKLVADIGLVGLPNAGKSTLLAVISNAHPEIADYPFTTVTPNLGVADIDGTTVLVADIPGLIEGASQGKGLGDEFLRHLERTSVLLQLVDATAVDPVADYQTVVRELKDYVVDLSTKPRLVVLTKIEAITLVKLKAVKLSLSKHLAKEPAGRTIYPISAPAHRGLDEPLRAALKVVRNARRRRARAERSAIPIIDATTLTGQWQVVREGEGIYRAAGERIERFARRTDPANEAALDRLRDIMYKLGIAKELNRQGVQPGDLVRVGQHELTW